MLHSKTWLDGTEEYAWRTSLTSILALFTGLACQGDWALRQHGMGRRNTCRYGRPTRTRPYAGKSSDL